MHSYSVGYTNYWHIRPHEPRWWVSTACTRIHPCRQHAVRSLSFFPRVISRTLCIAHRGAQVVGFNGLYENMEDLLADEEPSKCLPVADQRILIASINSGEQAAKVRLFSAFSGLAGWQPAAVPRSSKLAS